MDLWGGPLVRGRPPGRPARIAGRAGPGGPARHGPGGPPHFRLWQPYALIAALLVPLVLLAFKPVEEIDSINYLHYLIEWLANRATPYTFATNYVAFWELSFAPVWMVTRVDLFFPLLALKAVVLMVLGLWLVGRQLGVPGKFCSCGRCSAAWRCNTSGTGRRGSQR